MTWSDLRMLLRLAILGLVAWLVPENAWRSLREPFVRSRGASTAQLRGRVEQLLGRPVTEPELKELSYRAVAGDYEDTLRVLRSYRPGGWQPEISLQGAEHLQQALQQGRGALLWVANCCGNRLVTKMALTRAGFAIHHLSRPTHGFSATPFGMRFLNPHWQTIENRFLAERIVMSDNSIRVMKRLKTLLKENRIVSITDHSKARQHEEVPFLQGTRSVATGPANLAVSAGAPLLPVFCRETGTGQFAVTIAQPLDHSAELNRGALMAHYSEALGSFVTTYPQMWLGWWWDTDLRPDGISAGASIPSKQGAVAG